MKHTLRLSLITLVSSVLFFFTSSSQQISIIGTDVNPYNVSLRGLCQVTIMNPGTSTQVVMQAELLDAANEPLITVVTSPFGVRTGLNVAASLNFTFSSVVYGTTGIVTMIRNSNILPTGKYNYCVKIMAAGNTEGDVNCQELESDITSYLFLINPEDKDTVNSPYPILTWNHNDPYNLLCPGEYYRIIVAPMNKGESPEEAITVNTPVYLKNNLTELQVQYPFDAPALEPGKHYAWQVQRISGDVIINKTEAWEFIEPISIPVTDNKYAVMRNTPDAGFYEATNERIFFRFDESYATTGVTSCIIYDNAMKEVKMRAKNSRQKDAQGIALKQQGYNQYEVDLKGMDVKNGFYYLEIKNGKGKKYMLRFHVN